MNPLQQKAAVLYARLQFVNGLPLYQLHDYTRYLPPTELLSPEYARLAARAAYKGHLATVAQRALDEKSGLYQHIESCSCCHPEGIRRTFFKLLQTATTSQETEFMHCLYRIGCTSASRGYIHSPRGSLGHEFHAIWPYCPICQASIISPYTRSPVLRCENEHEMSAADYVLQHIAQSRKDVPA
jgi:hypothetical protein